MAKLIRRTVKKRGAALIVALQLTVLTLLSLVSFVGGPQQSSNPLADLQVKSSSSAAVASAKEASASSSSGVAQTDQAETQTVQASTAISRSDLRASAHFAKKLYEPRASQVFNLATRRAESQAGQRSAQESESPNTEPTLTTDRQDYPPYSYVYFHGTGFQPGETVDMIVVETDPVQQSFQPWTVVADANGEFDTSWYIFSQDFNGATFQATATGESSQLTASCTFTDATIPYIIAPTFTTPGATVTFSTLVQETSSAVGSIRYTVPPIPAGWTILSGSVTATSNNSTWAPGVVGGGGSTITFLATAANAV